MTGTTFMVTIVFLTPDFISQLSVDGFLDLAVAKSLQSTRTVTDADDDDDV